MRALVRLLIECEIAQRRSGAKIVAMIVCGAHSPEHAHVGTKWYPAKNLVTQNIEKVPQEHLMFQQNEGTNTWAL